MPVSERAGRRFCYGTGRMRFLFLSMMAASAVKADAFLAVMVEDLAKK